MRTNVTQNVNIISLRRVLTDRHERLLKIIHAPLNPMPQTDVRYVEIVGNVKNKKELPPSLRKCASDFWSRRTKPDCPTWIFY